MNGAGAGHGDTALMLVELGAVFLVLALLARLAHRARLSPIPLYLLVGLAFGEGGLAPLDISRQFVEVSAEIGVVLLLFLLGLEYTADELTAGLRSGAWAGALDLAANFAPGFAAGLLLGWEMPVALLLGGITYISSSGVIAKLLSDLGRMGNRETPAVLSLLVTEDLVMAAYLPLVAAILTGGAADGARSVLVAVTALVAVLALALRFGGPITRAIASRSDEGLVLAALGLVLLVAGVAERLQVSSAVGAFLVGIALSGEVAQRTRALLSPLRDLFAATFFVLFALQVDPRSIPGVALVAVGLAAVTAATKMITGWYAAGRLGVGVRGRTRAATTLVARGEFSIVIAEIGVSAGVGAHLGPLAATYVLLLAVAGPLLARAADPVGAALDRRLG